MDMFFNRKSAFPWVQTVIFSSICSFIRIEHTSYKSFSWKSKGSFHVPLYRSFPSLNNYKFDDFVDRIYPIEHEIKDATDTDRCACYLDLHLEIDSDDWLRMQSYEKRDDVNFPIVKFPFICSTIPAAPAYGVFIS